MNNIKKELTKEELDKLYDFYYADDCDCREELVELLFYYLYKSVGENKND